MPAADRAANLSSSVRGAFLLIVLLAAFVAVAVAGSLWLHGRLDDAAALQRSLVDAQQQIDEVIRVQLEEENGLRGYLASGQSYFLEPYLANADRFSIGLEDFRRGTASLGISGMASSLAEMRSLHETWQRMVARPLIGDPHRRDALTRETLGKVLVDQLRGDANRVHELLQERLERAQVDLNRCINEALLGGLAAIALFAAGGVWFVASRAKMLSKIERERSIVETLQGAFRTDLDRLPGSRIGTAYLSADADSAVGGDLYDVRRIDDARGLVIVADVSGKGLEAAVNTAFVKYAMRTLAFTDADPAAILTSFNRLFLETIRDPSIFVVAFVGIIDVDQADFRYASAGHAGAFLRRAGQVVQLEVTGPIVGLAESPGYENRTLPLLAGDLLVLATDGLTEARDAGGNILDDAGAMALLRATSADPQACADELAGAVRRMSAGAPRDDLALLVIAIDGKTAPCARPSEAAA
ncbi:MAG: SpoIIE family protein phosphatase [Candidatus Baltobacteraceae bacterium]|jgi:serine phosphatase RsbU (regulator of sigma subunit)